MGWKRHLWRQSVIREVAEVAEETSAGIEVVSESLTQPTLTSKYKSMAAEEHLKVMTCCSATCRGAGEERNGIIYQCSFSWLEC